MGIHMVGGENSIQRHFVDWELWKVIRWVSSWLGE